MARNPFASREAKERAPRVEEPAGLLGHLNQFTGGVNDFLTSPEGQIAMGLLASSKGQFDKAGGFGSRVGPAIQNVLNQQAQRGLIQAQTKLAEAGPESARLRTQSTRTLANGNIGIVTNDPTNPVIDTGFKEAGKSQILNVPGFGLLRHDPVTNTISQVGPEEIIQKGIEERAGAETTGGAVARAKFELPVELAKAEANLNNVDANIDDVNTALGKVRPGTTGYSQLLAGRLPASQARELAKAARTVVAQLALQSLKDLKATGATLGQVSEKELELLENAVQAVDPLAEPAELVRQLQQVLFHYNNVKSQIIESARALQEQAQVEPDFQRPEGGDIFDPTALSDEELQRIASGAK
jgi:hypothetical protein